MRPLHLVIPFAIALGASAAPLPASAQISVDVAVTEPPPELPVYEQPPLPAPGYIFTPGFWAYGDQGYYWVPGTWVEPPEPGLLWTPGYWGWNGGRYLFNSGYWGPEVGYYGGIDYGFGYGGLGYEGGYWRGGRLFYNSRVNNFGGVHVTNVYERNVTRVTVNRISFNGPNGINRRPEPRELAAANARHIPATSIQVQHVQTARQNPDLRAAVNHGRPPITATPRPAPVDRGNGAAPGPHAVTPRQGPGYAHPGSQMAPGHTGGVASPHPVNRGTAPHGGGQMAPGNAGGAAAPHAVNRGVEPRAPSGHMSGNAMSAPAAQQHHMQPTEPRPMSAPRPMSEPRPMAPRPMGMAPQSGGMGGPRPGAMSAPRPGAAPHPAAAPRPAGNGHEGKPQR